MGLPYRKRAVPRNEGQMGFLAGGDGQLSVDRLEHRIRRTAIPPDRRTTYAVILEYFIVFVLAMLAGLWATAAGVFMELDPLLVFLSAIAGSFTFTITVLFVGGSWRDKFVTRYFPDADERVADSKMGAILSRYGVPGFAFASIIFGPGLSLAGVLVLGIDRKRFFLWYAPITVVGYGLSVAFWALLA